MTACRLRRRIGALLPLALLCAVLAPSAHAAPADRAYALSNSALLSFDPAAPGSVTSTPLIGVNVSEALVGIDVRPQNGMLYGLGVNASADTATLYSISPETGVVTPISASAIAFTTDGSTPLDLPDAGWGFDVNPAADRIRVTTSAGISFRINPSTGAPVDGDNGGSAGSVSGVNPDGQIANAGNTVDGAAYTNDRANSTVTTLYTLSSTSDQLAIQNPPNGGTQTLGKDVTVGGTPLNFSAASGFDIDASVSVPASNQPVASGDGYAILTVGSSTHLYRIDLTSGAASDLGPLGDGTLRVQGLALQRDLADAGWPIVALSGSHVNLVRFQTATPGTSTSVALTGVTAGETVIGLAWRPQTGQLYGLGVNATANTATLYFVDPQIGTATALGVAGQIAFVDGVGTPIDLPDPAVVGWGIDVNPTVDRIRVVTGSGLNFRVNPNTGAPVDGNLNTTPAPPGTNPDGPINGLDAGATGVTAVAYTNAYGQSLTGGATTQYVLEPVANKLYVQNPPNAGTLTLGTTVTVGGLPLDFTSLTGFDLPPEVRVATSNAPAAGSGVAVLQSAGVSRVYTLDLATGAATLLGAAPTTLTSIALGRAQLATPDAPPGPPGPPPAPPGPPARGNDTTKPRVTRLALAFGRRKRVTISFSSSEAGSATIRVLREVSGRRVGRACRAGARRGRRCTIRTSYGTVRRALAAAGKVTVRFQGKVGRRALRVGGLHVEVVVRDAAGNASATAAKSGKVKR
ncbi:MAG TPA: DUF4394 domain-containing protein [Conexibacter sp.]|jgi:hypothetical protein|nr:DUF4394 domain-containing protein [Conexibacter sp.]